MESFDKKETQFIKEKRYFLQKMFNEKWTGDVANIINFNDANEFLDEDIDQLIKKAGVSDEEIEFLIKVQKIEDGKDSLSSKDQNRKKDILSKISTIGS